MDTTQETPEIVRGHWPLETRLLLRKEYITGKGSLPALCEKHRIPLNTAEEWQGDGEWTKHRTSWRKAHEARLTRQEITGEALPETTEQREIKGLDERVNEVEKMIDEATQAFSTAVDAREMQAVAMTLDRLYTTWSLLTGHERPGIRKPSNRSRPQAPSFDNLEAK